MIVFYDIAVYYTMQMENRFFFVALDARNRVLVSVIVRAIIISAHQSCFKAIYAIRVHASANAITKTAFLLLNSDKIAVNERRYFDIPLLSIMISCVVLITHCDQWSVVDESQSLFQWHTNLAKINYLFINSVTLNIKSKHRTFYQ